MSTLPKRRYSVQEYLELEQSSETKHEFYQGEVFAMTGGTVHHSEIAGNIYLALRLMLRGTLCRPYNSDLRIAVTAVDLFTYPDLSVICGPLEHDPRDDNSIINPVALIEVLSRTTESYDRGRKFGFYRQLASLRAYVLVAQDEPRLEAFSRQSDGSWRLIEAAGLDATLRLPDLEWELRLADVYDNVPVSPGVAPNSDPGE